MKSWLKGFLAAVSVLPALSGIAFGAAVPFTWDPSKANPPLAGSAFTADTIDATNYLRSIIQPNGSFDERLVLKINGFQFDGQPVFAPGLNTAYGLYFVINATGQQVSGITTFNALNISLMADPGNNNGTLSASVAAISFSNTGPTGVSDDFVLGTGTLYSASMAFNPATMVRSAHFVENFSAAPNEAGFFGSISPLLEELLTTSPAAFQALPQPDGSTIVLVNGGIAQAAFVPEPASILLVASDLLGLGLARRLRVYRVHDCPSVT